MNNACVVALVFSPKEKIQLERLFYSVFNQKESEVYFLALDVSDAPLRFSYELFSHPNFSYLHLPSKSLKELVPYLLDRSMASSFFMVKSHFYFPPYFFNDFLEKSHKKDFIFLKAQHELNNKIYGCSLKAIGDNHHLDIVWMTREMLIAMENQNISLQPHIQLKEEKGKSILNHPLPLLTDLEI